MDRWFASCRVNRVLGWVGVLWIILGMAACDATLAVAPAASDGAVAPLQLSFTRPPGTLCRSLTQFRLTPHAVGTWPSSLAATWSLRAWGDGAALSQGQWTPAAEELLVTFPDGQPLAPGTYAVTLQAGESVSATHVFTVSAALPELTALAISLTPDGPALERLPEGTRHFYVQYVYQGTCSLAPFWLTVQRAEETLCAPSGTLEAAAGQGAAACYRVDGAPFAPGAYTANFTLMGQATRALTFTVEAEPALSPTPTPSTPQCEPLFVATGLTAAGEAYLPKQSFEWYTQAVYAGSRCQALSAGTPWRARWFRSGQLLRESTGTWDGAASGVIWDSLTGVPKIPFLRSGAYTMTLQVADAAPLEAGFTVVAYATPAPTQAAP